MYIVRETVCCKERRLAFMMFVNELIGFIRWICLLLRLFSREAVVVVVVMMNSLCRKTISHARNDPSARASVHLDPIR